jgi:hypothetical protein
VRHIFQVVLFCFPLPAFRVFKRRHFTGRRPIDLRPASQLPKQAGRRKSKVQPVRAAWSSSGQLRPRDRVRVRWLPLAQAPHEAGEQRGSSTSTPSWQKAARACSPQPTAREPATNGVFGLPKQVLSTTEQVEGNTRGRDLGERHRPRSGGRARPRG